MATYSAMELRGVSGGRPTMLKRRVIISLCINDGVLFRTKRFVPDYRYTTSYLAVDAVDEVFLVDITRGGPSAASRAAMAGYAERCFAPVTMGGWVGNGVGPSELFAIGADKVLVGSGIAAANPYVISDYAEKWGSQAVVVGVNARNGMWQGRNGSMAFVSSEKAVWHADSQLSKRLPDKNGGFVSPDHGAGLPYPGRTPAQAAGFAAAHGAGEIFFQSIDRDGSLSGYDLAVLREIASAVRIPVVVGGGCGGFQHMIDGFRAGADGCVTSNIFHFTETSLAGFKRELLAAGIPVREAA